MKPRKKFVPVSYLNDYGGFNIEFDKGRGFHHVNLVGALCLNCNHEMRQEQGHLRCFNCGRCE